MFLHDDVADWSQLFRHQSKICFVIGRSSYFIPFQLVEFRSMSIRLAPEIGIHLPVEPPNPDEPFVCIVFLHPTWSQVLTGQRAKHSETRYSL